MQQVPSARTEFRAGLRDFIPLLMGVFPFGMICGAAAVSAGMDFWQAFSMSWIIFAGSSQIAATQLLASGAPVFVIIATATVINLRFMMYSASLSPHFSTLGGRWHALLAYLLTDQGYALSITRFMEIRDNPNKHWYYLAISGGIWVCWQIATLAGILLGRLVPSSWSLDFILPLTFIAIVVPLLANKAMLCAAVAGGLAAILLTLPLKLNLIAAACIGMAVGLMTERLWKKA